MNLIKKIAALIFTFLCLVGNFFLIYVAYKTPLWPVSNLGAYPSFGLFVFLIIIGLPVLITSLVLMTYRPLIKNKWLSFIGLIAKINIIIPIILFILIFNMN